MAKFVKVDSIVNDETMKTEYVFVNIDLITHAVKRGKKYVIHLANGEKIYAAELPMELLPPIE